MAKHQTTMEKVLIKKGLSKRQFALRQNIQYHHVYRLLKDDYDPKVSTVIKWAKILEMKPVDLFKALIRDRT